MSSDSNEGTETRPAHPKYVKDILSAITPEFLERARAEGSSTISPMDAITTKRYSRIFDTLEITLDKRIAKEYSDNVLRFGYEYACAKAINPLIEAMVDIKRGCLQQDFIERAFGSDEKFRELFKEEKDFDIAHGFIDACTILFSSAIQSLNLNLNDPTVSFITALRGSYDKYRNSECAGQLKLFDEGKKYHFCARMSDDIKSYLGHLQAFNDPEVVDRRIPHELEEKPEVRAFVQFTDLIRFIDDCEQELKKQLNSNDSRKLRTDLKLAETVLKLAETGLEEVDRVKYLQELTELKLVEQQQINLIFTAVATLFVVGVIATLTFATFGGGAALIPLIPGIVSFCIAACMGMGIAASAYFADKCRKAQAVASHAKIEAAPAEAVGEPTNFPPSK